MTDLTVITASEFAEQSIENETEEIVSADWDKTMEELARPHTRMRIPRNSEFSRKDVVQAFSNAFELIGGIPRLALWAHANESDFYKLYARLLPSQASSALGETNELIVKHVLPRSPLDE